MMTIAIGHLTLHPHRQLLDGDRVLPIGAKALDILSLLAQSAGNVITKDELIGAVWNGAAVEDNALQAQISQLRKVLGPGTANLVAVHGRGYRLELSGEAGQLDGKPDQRPSVAVLPFTNLTGDPAKDYICDGMAEEVIVTLSRAAALKVPARTSSFAYRSRDVDVRTIARDLGVANVLEGSLRAAGERIRVTAQLVEAETGFHLWGRNYDREFGDLFALQDEIAGEIASALKSELGVTSEYEPDFEAYHLFMQARALMGTQNVNNLILALNLLDRAIELDPGYARFHASRGFCRHLCIMFGLAGPETREQIERDTEAAKSLDPRLSWVYTLKAILCSTHGDWVGAHEAAMKGLSLDEFEPESLNGFGLQGCAPLGQIDRGLRLVEQARKLAPAFPITHALLAMMHSIRGDLQQAEAAIAMAVDLGIPSTRQPASPIIAQLAVERGDYEAATAALAGSFPPIDSHPGALKVAAAVYSALAGKGDRQVASNDVQELFEAVRATGKIPLFNVVFVWMLDWQVRLGFLDRAFAIADEHVARFRQHSFVSQIALLPVWNPWMRPFREDPRFQDYARAFNMFEFWEKFGPPDGHDLIEGKLVVR